MLDSCIVPSFAGLLQAFQPCFTAPSFTSFVSLAAGWVLNLRRHTVTEKVRAAQAIRTKHISSFHRFFSRGRWVTDDVGLVLVRLVASLQRNPGKPLVVPIDEGIVKIVGISEDLQAVARCETDVRQQFGDHVSAARSQPYYLDVTHPNANKGVVVRRMSELRSDSNAVQTNSRQLAATVSSTSSIWPAKTTLVIASAKPAAC
jgi:hypothetical protein